MSKGVIGGDEILSCISYINLCISVRSRFYYLICVDIFLSSSSVKKVIRTICHEFEISVKILFWRIKIFLGSDMNICSELFIVQYQVIFHIPIKNIYICQFVLNKIISKYIHWSCFSLSLFVWSKILILFL